MRVLNVEDDPRDSALIERELQKCFGAVELTRVDNPEAFSLAIAEGRWDVIVADHALPRFSSLGALAALHVSGKDIPVVVVSGTMGLSFAVEAMRAGARDYLVKSDLVRLGPVVEREIRDAAARRLEAARHALVGEVLELLNVPGELAPQLRIVLEKLRRHAGADAAGIRLRQATDFPYVAQVGFRADFLEEDAPLSVLDEKGWRVRSGARSEQEGYESMVLLPLKSGVEVVGLLQLCAKAPDRFGPELIHFLEEIAPSLTTAVERRRSEEARRSTEERYRVLVETAPDGVALVGLDGRILKANRRLVEMLGEEDAAAIDGRGYSEFVPDEDRGRAEREFAGLLERGVVRDAAFRIRGREATFDGELSATVAAGADGAPNAIVVVVRDVTERLRLQARLAQSDRMASVGMLAAGVAHEVNNPLTYVLHNLESLVADLPALEAAAPRAGEPRELARRAEEALVGIRRIRAIIRDLKGFSGAGSDRLEPVALNAVVQGSINLASNEIKFRARLETDFGELPPVLANEGRLAQVFLNLLVNAAHAIQDGDVGHNRISVKTWAEEGAVFAEVRDSGAGMTDEVKRQVFDPFFTTKPKGVGSGLGLSISREIVEAFHGRITVESAVGEGSRFRVQLPAMPSGRVPSSEPGPAGEQPLREAARRGRVLVVDDEPLVRASMVRLLRSENDVVEAGGGAAAAAILAANDRFDVILCDLVMPELSGMELHARLAVDRSDLAARMIFVSGGAFTSRAQAFLDAVPNARIEKPFDSIGLRELVRARVRACGSE